MESLILLGSALLFLGALRSHAIAQAHATIKIEREWFERLFTGSRVPKENLTEVGLHYRKQSNKFAVGGFILIGVYTAMKFT